MTPNNNNNMNDKQNTIKLGKYDLKEGELIPGLPHDIALHCLLKLPITSHPTLKRVSNLWNSTLSHPSFFSLRRRSGTAEHLVFLTQPLSPVSPPLPPPPPPHHQQPQRSNTHKDDHNSHQPQHNSEFAEDQSSLSLIYKLNVYSSATKEWRSLYSDDGDFVVPTFAQCVSVPHSAKVVLLGGWNPATLDPSTRVVVIDLAAGTWAHGAPMPTARSFFAAVAAGGGVYVAGGHDARKNALRSAEFYDVEADEWRKLPDMAEERDECHGLATDNSTIFWAVSGYGTETQGRFRSDAEYYDAETNNWVKVDGAWPHAGETAKGAAVVGGRRWLSLVGGELKEFEVDDNVWKAAVKMGVPEKVRGWTAKAMVEVGGGSVMVVGNGGCGGGDGVYLVSETETETAAETEEREKEWRWECVDAPVRFLGFPFSSTHVFI
ncbi:hypothetical protein vseg_008166 [Gypsophila vaccaria]